MEKLLKIEINLRMCLQFPSFITVIRSITVVKTYDICYVSEMTVFCYLIVRSLDYCCNMHFWSPHQSLAAAY